jgi:signal transduction histidine kinase
MMLLFCAVVGVLLLGSYAGLYAFLARSVHRQFDRRLLDAAAPVVADLRADADPRDITELDVPGEYFGLLEPSGRLQFLSKNLQGRAIDLPVAVLPVSSPVLADVTDSRLGALRVALVPVRLGEQPYVLLLAMPVEERDAILASLRSILAILLPSSLLVVALVSAWYVGHRVRPIAELTRETTALAGRLVHSSGRVNPPAALPVANPSDEVGKLAAAFNQLSALVEGTLGELRQFVSDASHELRTPLSVLRGETELLLSKPRAPEEYQKALQVIDGELKRLSHITQGLFTLAMADAGQLRLEREPLYINEVLEEACALMASRAQAKSIGIDRCLEQEVPYLGDEAFLRQLFLIFLENATKYSPPNTRIRVSLTPSDSVVEVRVEDQGFGIAPEHLPHIFERFYRAPQPVEHDGEAQSGGLGLAIAQAIVRAEGGTIDCASHPGAGSTFTIRLPVPPTPPAQSAKEAQRTQRSLTSHPLRG